MAEAVSGRLEPEPMRGRKAGEFWLDTIDRAMEFRRKHWNGEQAWRRYQDLFKGDHWKSLTNPDSIDQLSSDDPREKITVNLTGSNVLNMLPFLIRQRPKYLLKGRRPEDVVSASLQEAVLNYNWTVRNMQKQLKRSALDAVVLGHGIIKTGYTLEVLEDVNVKPRANGTLEYKDYIAKDEPFIQRVSPFRFIFDPEAEEYDLATARWCAEILIKPLRDVVENSRYNAKVRAAIKKGSETPTRVASFLAGAKSEDAFKAKSETERRDLDRIVLLEIWDKRTGKYYVMAHGIETPLIEEETWPYDYMQEKGTFPFEMLPFIPLIDEPYPLGLPAFMEDQQHELNRNRTAMFQARRRMARKYQAVEGQIDPDDLDDLRTGEDGTIIIVKSKDAVTPIDHAALPTDVYNIEGTIKQDIRELIGADELIRGGQLPSRTTATEVNTRTQLLGLKLEDRVEAVDRFVEAIGRKILMHIKANYTSDDVVRISGPKGEFWVEFTPEDLKAPVDIEIESTSGEQTDEGLLRGQALQIMQMVIDALPIFQQAGVQVNVGELFKWVFSHFDTNEVQRFFPDAGTISPPLEQTVQPQQTGGSNIGASPPASPASPLPPDLQLQQDAASLSGLANSRDLAGILGGTQGGI
jgi:hypothetical protein